MSRRPALLLSLAVAWAAAPTGAGAAAAKEPVMRIVDRPPTTGAAAWYPGWREPLQPVPFWKLPLGAVKPAGWVRTQLRSMADGFVGHLPEISAWCKFDGNAWVAADGAGHSPWEELPYWFRGFHDLAWLLDDPALKAEAARWTEGVLRSRQPDGWFGPRENRDSQDLWPNMVMLYALRANHEATGDPRVLELLTGYFRYQAALGADGLFRKAVQRGWWQQIRGADNLDTIHWLYLRTGEPWLLELAQVNHQRTADWTNTVPTWHGVNLCESFRGPAQAWWHSGNPALLAATDRVYDEVWSRYGQVPGGLFGADENARPGYTGPRQAAETCSMAEFMYSAELLLRLTGDAKWAARCEDVAFNSLPAALTADWRGLHYLTAPNMVQLDRPSKAPLLQNGGDMLSYNPRQYRCCQHNVAFAWPYYVEHLWLATPAGGLAAALYAPCSVTARVGDGTAVTIEEQTDYPFDDRINLRVLTSQPVAFPLTLRIPDWAVGPTVTVGGETLPARAGWAQIERTWRNGDTVEVRLPMRVALRRWPQNRGTVSVDRGPLTYSLKIDERTEPYGQPDPWHGVEVFPASPWNYGLVLGADPAAGFATWQSAGPLPAQPWVADAPVELRATGRRIAAWRQEDNGLIGEVQPGPVRSDAPDEEVRLVPLGCARLRVAAFPVIGDGPDARDWAVPEVVASASHCFASDTVAALHDGLEPQASNDHGLPRFTWWDHRGTAEWVAYRFAKPRQVSAVTVYWFDDTGQGQCRVPASWRLLYDDGGTWRPVTTTDAYGVAPDASQRVRCEPVTTSGLRIEVQLRPGYSGGILEWRVEP